MKSTITVLIVEDEDIIRSLLSEAMEDEGFAVVGTATADDAMILIQNGASFDLLMTDIQLPGRMDGLDLARWLRDQRSDLPIIFTTGQPDRMLPWQSSERDLFIPKPYRPSQMRAAARRLTAR